MLSNLNFGKFVLFVVVVNLVGCADTKIRPETLDILHIQPDCRIAERQLEWLRGMIPTQQERMNANMQVGIFDKFSKEYQLNRDVVEYKYDYIIRMKIKDIYRSCAKRQSS